MAGLTILVVEDEALVALNLVSLLEDHGHNVLGPAVSMRQALALAEANPPVLAFVDLNLTDGMTGERVAFELAERYGTMVAIVSATPGDLREGEGGVSRILAKPYADRSILEIVERARLAAREKAPRWDFGANRATGRE